MFVVVLLILATLALIRYSYPQRLVRLATAVIRVRVLFQLMREEMVMAHRTAVALFLIFSTSSGLMLYLAAKRFHWPVYEFFGLWLFPLAAGVIAALYLWKIIAIKLVQLLFGGNGGLSEYLNYTFVIHALLGVVWLPAIVIAAVTLPRFSSVILIAMACVFGIAWITRIIQGVQFGLQHGVFSVYIFLYLCALEILPLAVIAKGVAEVRF